jgi:hypothetical protein
LTRSAGAPVATIRSISTLQKRRLIRSPKKTTIAVPTAEVGLADTPSAWLIHRTG